MFTVIHYASLGFVVVDAAQLAALRMVVGANAITEVSEHKTPAEADAACQRCIRFPLMYAPAEVREETREIHYSRGW